MSETNTSTSTATSTPAGSAPGAATGAAPSTAAFTFPDALPPKHECDWLTDKESRQKLEARCCGIQVSTDRKGSPLAYVALRLEPNQQVFSAVSGTVEEFGGTVAITTRYLTGGATENTMNALRILGFDVAKARAAYAQDPQALAMVQQAKAKGFDDDRIDQVLSMLAMQRGDIAACGLGSKVARVDSKEDTFTPSKGDEIVTRKVNWIEAIPAAVSADAVFGLADLLGGSMRPAKAAAKGAAAPAKAASSQPPKAASSKPDDVDF